MQIGLVLCGVYLAVSWQWLLRLPGAESPTDPAAAGLVLVVFSVGFAIFKPFSAWVSRRLEANAHRSLRRRPAVWAAVMTMPEMSTIHHGAGTAGW